MQTEQTETEITSYINDMRGTYALVRGNNFAFLKIQESPNCYHEAMLSNEYGAMVDTAIAGGFEMYRVAVKTNFGCGQEVIGTSCIEYDGYKEGIVDRKRRMQSRTIEKFMKDSGCRYTEIIEEVI